MADGWLFDEGAYMAYYEAMVAFKRLIVYRAYEEMAVFDVLRTIYTKYS